MSDRIIFIDRDGTMVIEPPADKQVDALAKIQLVPGVIPAMLELRDAGYEFVMISNQDGLGTESFPEAAFTESQNFILHLFASQGITFREVFICPHFAEDRCNCRKPLPGLLTPFLRDNAVDRNNSYVIGDRQTDLDLATNIGVSGILIDPEDTGAWARIAKNITRPPRVATVKRKTKETDITVSVDLDTPGIADIDTGIGFYDHMLEQVAKHGGFSLSIKCKGDLEIDEHHTVEDVALALGQAIRNALGDKRGIGRYGFTVPMDEAQASVAIDLGGRPFLVFEGAFDRDTVGGLPTELVPHIFRSLSDTLAAAIHVTVTGENAHHMIEGCFKATGRALRQAFAREGNELPSTKGSL
jgi:imidazoleglycerol-phosphate dehydratase / histidinol-phosphatase